MYDRESDVIDVFDQNLHFHHYGDDDDDDVDDDCLVHLKRYFQLAELVSVIVQRHHYLIHLTNVDQLIVFKRKYSRNKVLY